MDDNSQGNFRIEPAVHCMYDEAWGFSESLTDVKLDGKHGFLGKVAE